jgi:two-component system chemotaxis response regulator CheY
VARDGVQAWELYKGDRFDVVISDWTMPGMDGTELCRRVRGAGAEHGYTYFIFATSLSDRQHFSTGMASGADDYLTKPFDPLDLRARLTVARRVTSLYYRVMQDSVELQRLNQDLFEQSRVDPLTQLGNRLRLTEDLELLDGRAQRYGHTYAIAILDVDHFKRYNDRYGHPEGDEVLRAVARMLRECSRQGDAAYRYGGEEFVLVLPDQDLFSAVAAMEHIGTGVKGLNLAHEGNLPGGVVTLSAGVAARGPGDIVPAVKLLKRADEALYRAKQSGRDRVTAWDPVGKSWIEQG